jgi:hypothetical protein
MARSTDWEKLPMAAGDPAPAWPLPSVTPKFATWSVGGGRPANCTLETCERWHAGIDLTGAPDGATIVAPEDALVVGIDRGWSEGAKAAFLRTKTGLFLVLGGFKVGSHKEFGIQTAREVRKGEKLGKVLGSYGMIHLETYTAASRTANSVWWESEPPPDGLLNPINYVERMVGDRVSLVQTQQRHEALAALGYYAGNIAAAWGAASDGRAASGPDRPRRRCRRQVGSEDRGRDPAGARVEAPVHDRRVRRAGTGADRQQRRASGRRGDRQVCDRRGRGDRRRGGHRVVDEGGIDEQGNARESYQGVGEYHS